VSLIRKFWFYFSPEHFLIGDAATTTKSGYHWIPALAESAFLPP